MYRQSPSRNQRSKGVKVKYAVQICLLLAVSFWLVYQLKRSHDKKKEFDETDAKASLRMHSSSEKNSVLGRKGIISQEDEITSINDDKLHEPIEEDETVEEENKEEEDENKTEEEEEEENSKAEEDEDKTEEDESKPEEDENKAEVDEPEEKNVDHEQENPDADENEARVDSNDGNVSIDKSTHEARDENYKADDASSAVTHEADENVNEGTENSKALEEYNKEVKKDSEVEGGEIAGVDQKSNAVITERNLDALRGSENSSPPNDTLIIEKSSRGLEINGSTDVGTENRDLSETKHEMDQDSNSTDSTGTKDVEIQKLENFSSLSSNGTYSLPSDSSEESENKMEDEMETEKLDLNDGTDEKSESAVTENPDEEIQHDGIDESDVSESLEDKRVSTDLDTLPEIQMEGTIGDNDVATE